MKINIFENKRQIDLSTFIDSRALICANSGGGKSYAIRKILEETNDKVMAIVLDIEGEFKTLREKFDFLLIGDKGDVPLNMKSASLLPAKLLELNTSTIIDISDLKMHERVMYVKKFLEALMEVKRDLWKPCIIVVDEAHLLAGQQEKQESTHAVIDLMTRGRKRGFCGILCSQRIAKLHKDAVAEANNYLVGRTGLDIDMKRASEILGFTSKEQMLSLRDLEPGEFYVFGTALSKGVEKEKIASVLTTHPKVGMDIKERIVPPTDKVKQILNKISDLPKEAEHELKTINELKNKINQLHKELAMSKKNISVKEKVIQVADNESLKKAFEKGVKESERKYNLIIKSMENDSRTVQKSIERLMQDASKLLQFKSFSIISDRPIIPVPEFKETKKFTKVTDKSNQVLVTPTAFNKDNTIGGGASRILKASAMFYPNPITKARAGAIAGLSYKSGTFNTYLSNLKKEGLIESIGNEFVITQEGLEKVGDIEPIPSDPESLVNMWVGIIKGGGARILRVLFDNYPESINREELGSLSALSFNSGSFNTYLSTLKRNGLIEINGKEIKISEEFFR